MMVRKPCKACGDVGYLQTLTGIGLCPVCRGAPSLKMSRPGTPQTVSAQSVLSRQAQFGDPDAIERWRNHATRDLANELLDSLQSAGMITYEFDEMPMTKDMRLVASISVVPGAHSQTLFTQDEVNERIAEELKLAGPRMLALFRQIEALKAEGAPTEAYLDAIETAYLMEKNS